MGKGYQWGAKECESPGGRIFSRGALSFLPRTGVWLFISWAKVTSLWKKESGRYYGGTSSQILLKQADWEKPIIHTYFSFDVRKRMRKGG